MSYSKPGAFDSQHGKKIILFPKNISSNWLWGPPNLIISGTAGLFSWW
jgi:hypothetical protein